MTLKRVKRAFRDLVTAGLITSTIQREKQPDGSWRSYASIKTIQRALLIPFNIIWMLEREQLRRYKQQRKKQQQAQRQHRTCKSSDAPKQRSDNDPASPTQPRPSHPPSTADPPQAQHWPLPLPRRLLEAAHRIGELDGALNLGQCIQQAKQLLA
jgi:predicted lipid-binding transport protein (Tim44 family)